MWIKFKYLTLISVLANVEVSPSNVSSVTADYSSSTSMSSSSICFLLFTDWFQYLLSKTLSLSLFVFVFFCPVDFVFFVASIHLPPYWFFVCVDLVIKRFSLVTLSYQLPLNNTRNSYVIYGWTISTTYHYSVHNRS